MAIHVNINFFEAGASIESARAQAEKVQIEKVEETEPLPPAGISGFLSHFVIALKLPGRKGLVVLTLPSAVQTVARSNPFVYQGETASRQAAAELPLPRRCSLANRIEEKDFLVRPKGFFQPGHEAVWLQILNLDARASNTEIGPVRIILGETLKREYPDVFLPSLGAVESIGRAGFPARLFFSPVAVFETSIGVFRTTPKALLAARVNSLPPLGAGPVLQEPIRLQALDDLRAAAKAGTALSAVGPIIVSLEHPIDGLLLQDPEESFEDVQEGAAAKLG
jgi:hypothetical protein